MSLHSCQTGVARLNGRRRQHPRWTVPPTLVLCLTVLADGARAQAPEPEPEQKPATELSQLTLQELTELKIDSVYGASRYTQKVTEAPASVTIITREEIRKYGHTTLADVLRSVRGFYVTYDRNYSYLGVRGFSRPGDYNARVLLLIDGHRLNDNIFGGALIGTEFPMDVDLIDRVEIIRGPSSSLYGTSAFFAVINVITRGADSTKGIEASGSLGTFDTRKGRLSYGRTLPQRRGRPSLGVDVRQRGPTRPCSSRNSPTRRPTTASPSARTAISSPRCWDGLRSDTSPCRLSTGRGKRRFQPPRSVPYSTIHARGRSRSRASSICSTNGACAGDGTSRHVFTTTATATTAITSSISWWTTCRSGS